MTYVTVRMKEQGHVFDILYINGRDITEEPLIKRKKYLDKNGRPSLKQTTMNMARI